MKINSCNGTSQTSAFSILLWRKKIDLFIVTSSILNKQIFMNFAGCLGKRDKFLANSRKVFSIQSVREEKPIFVPCLGQKEKCSFEKYI